MTESQIDLEKPTGYAYRFATHISDYIKIAGGFPDIRLREFQELINFADLKDPRTVLEVPAEGRIMEGLLPETKIVRADMMEVKTPKGQEIHVTDWGLSGVAANSFDAVLSIVPIHHADHEEKKSYVEGAWRVLKPKGVFAFGEVERNSKVERFLDGFVNDHTESGHVGAYVDLDFVAVLREAGFDNVSAERRNCDWVFGSYDSVFDYVTRLFNLKARDPASLFSVLRDQLGLKEEDGRIVLPWHLLYFRGEKPSSAFRRSVTR